MSRLTKLDVEHLEIRDQRVLVRVDFNVPLHRGKVGDDTRIRSALPTIRAITSQGGEAILMSHLGRPKGTPDPALSLAPIAEHLDGLIDEPVRFVGATTGEPAQAAVDALPSGGVLVLENTRFLPGETKNDPAVAAELATLADVFVNDAFGTAHRAHASTEGVAHRVERAAMGLLLKKEIECLARLLEQPDQPFVAVLGGAKVSDKIGIIENLLTQVDALLVGGAMSYTFLKALGREVGRSKVEEDRLDTARALYERAHGKIKLPTDHVVADAFDNDATRWTVSGAIPGGAMGLDVGPGTVEAYCRMILQARTVVWNGPMGVFEMPNFEQGTFAIADAVADATAQGAWSVVGGGDSVAAVSKAGYADRIGHVSTGGGAMLEFLEGKTLPGIAALSDR